MRHKTILVFLFCLTLLAFGTVTESVRGQEAPQVFAQANSPGWITVSWEHTGEGVYYFVIERQDAPYTDNSVTPIAQSNNRTDSVTDKNLKANTLYKYHVCAVYAYSRTCSDWVSVRTLAPPPPPSGGSSGSAPPPSALPPFVTPEIRATRDQDPTHILLDWSGDPGWESYELHDNVVNPPPIYKNSKLKHVVVYSGIPGTSKFTGAIYDSWRYPGHLLDVALSQLTYTNTVRPNFVNTYKVCFTSINDETKCSKEITASSKPIAPTAPANVTVSQDEVQDRIRDTIIRTRTLVTVRWRNTDIPGQFITLEREDRVQLGTLNTIDRDGRLERNQLRFGPQWIEIKRIHSAYVFECLPAKCPSHDDQGSITELTVDTTPEGKELYTERGNSYRICAIVPALGAAGKICSSPVTPLPKIDVIRPVDSKRINKDVLTPKKPE